MKKEKRIFKATTPLLTFHTHNPKLNIVVLHCSGLSSKYTVSLRRTFIGQVLLALLQVVSTDGEQIDDKTLSTALFSFHHARAVL
jgi:hypothetical protein